MTAPKEWEESSITEWPIGTNLFTSTILLFGLIPVDFHKFKFLDIQTTSFQECSTSLVNRQWRHYRSIEQQGSACVIYDTVEYIPKSKILGILIKPLYRAIFSHRHKRLKTRYK